MQLSIKILAPEVASPVSDSAGPGPPGLDGRAGSSVAPPPPDESAVLAGGAVGAVEVVYGAPGVRVIYAKGEYQQAILPNIRGQAVVKAE